MYKNKRIKNIYIDTELVLPIHNTYPYFYLKILGKKHALHMAKYGNISNSMPQHLDNEKMRYPPKKFVSFLTTYPLGANVEKTSNNFSRYIYQVVNALGTAG